MAICEMGMEEASPLACLMLWPGHFNVVVNQHGQDPSNGLETAVSWESMWHFSATENIRMILYSCLKSLLEHADLCMGGPDFNIRLRSSNQNWEPVHGFCTSMPWLFPQCWHQLLWIQWHSKVDEQTLLWYLQSLEIQTSQLWWTDRQLRSSADRNPSRPLLPNLAVARAIRLVWHAGELEAQGLTCVHV